MFQFFIVRFYTENCLQICMNLAKLAITCHPADFIVVEVNTEEVWLLGEGGAEGNEVGINETHTGQIYMIDHITFFRTVKICEDVFNEIEAVFGG